MCFFFILISSTEIWFYVTRLVETKTYINSREFFAQYDENSFISFEVKHIFRREHQDVNVRIHKNAEYQEWNCYCYSLKHLAFCPNKKLFLSKSSNSLCKFSDHMLHATLFYKNILVNVKSMYRVSQYITLDALTQFSETSLGMWIMY